jgi:protein-tyrosine phosphatase
VLDLHCHLLPAVDDGAKDVDSAVRIARAMAALGYHAVAPSPHYGEGPGGDVDIERATRARELLASALAEAHVELDLLPNAEHHVTPELYARAQRSKVVPIGGASRWLLVELPWRAVPQVEDALFRLQTRGYRLLLAHPERYTYVELDVLERLVSRDIKLQLELGSFVGVYGKRAERHAQMLAERGHAHVLASDLHRPEDAEGWLADSLQAVRQLYGEQALMRATDENPRAMVADALPGSVQPFLEMT